MKVISAPLTAYFLPRDTLADFKSSLSSQRRIQIIWGELSLLYILV